MLMAASPHVGDLAVYDLVSSPGVAVDISHINCRCKVEGYKGPKSLNKALDGSDVVILCAGLPRKPGMTRDDLFVVNAGIVMELARSCAKVCPNACFLVITNPVNSTVPIFSETLKKMGVLDPRKIMGVTELDTLRARTFLAAELDVDENAYTVPIVGGHAGTTIIPLFSQLPGDLIEQIDVPALTKRVQFGGDEVVVAKAGMGSATLSMAYAGATFANSVLAGLKGEMNIIEQAYFQQDVLGCKFFASQIELGRNGIERALPIPKDITVSEQKAIEKAVPVIQEQIAKGIKYVEQNF